MQAHTRCARQLFGHCCGRARHGVGGVSGESLRINMFVGQVRPRRHNWRATAGAAPPPTRERGRISHLLFMLMMAMMMSSWVSRWYITALPRAHPIHPHLARNHSNGRDAKNCFVTALPLGETEPIAGRSRRSGASRHVGAPERVFAAARRP